MPAAVDVTVVALYPGGTLWHVGSPPAVIVYQPETEIFVRAGGVGLNP